MVRAAVRAVNLAGHSYRPMEHRGDLADDRHSAGRAQRRDWAIGTRTATAWSACVVWTDHMALSVTTMFAKSPLSRAEREMMAVVVSATNGCRYCVTHHGEALLHFWKDPDRVAALAKEAPAPSGLSDREAALCRYARLVTQEPGTSDVDAVVADLRSLGLDDRAILDATLVVSYFNFVNRMVLALDVELEAEAGGYQYGAAE